MPFLVRDVWGTVCRVLKEISGKQLKVGSDSDVRVAELLVISEVRIICVIAVTLDIVVPMLIGRSCRCRTGIRIRLAN